MYGWRVSVARDEKPFKQQALPTGRFARFGRMARLASGVAGGMVAEGVKQWSKGQRPSMRDLLLTPSNAERVADRLSEMRGAAMKLGQMLSMDTGDFLPKPLADALSQLRAEAHTLPQKQTRATLKSIYGPDWPELFAYFDIEPFAAASIGQVHKAQLHDGRDIVLKLQYPGVLASIDADVDNMATLLRWSGLVPEQVEITPLLNSVKEQLKDEADYELERNYLRSFLEALKNDLRFWVPETVDELSNKQILAMSFVPGEPIESLEHADQAIRDSVMTALIELLLIELFELRLVQTDPNFANYRYDYESGRIVLLDFGATRAFKAKFVNDYKSLARAAVAGNASRMLAAADRLGYAIGNTDGPYRDLILEVFNIALEPLSTPGVYDFGESDMPQRMLALSNKITEHKDFWQVPPAEAIYFHRKIGGMFMLAHRLQARVPVYDLFQAAVKS